MSTNFPGLRPSHQHQREIDALLRGERVRRGAGVGAAAKRALDDAAKEYETFKLAKAREEAARDIAERAAQARESIAAARPGRDLNRAFAAAVRSLRR